MITAILLIVAWGVLVFGAVYPWAYIPLLAGSVGVGLAGLKNSRPRLSVPLAAFVLTLLAVVAQAVPLPRAVLAMLSPALSEVLAQTDLLFATTPASWHSLSINPDQTLRAAVFLLGWGALFWGVREALTQRSARRLVEGLILIGLLVGVLGVIQRTIPSDRIYGFWSPQQGGEPFGPFVNKNNYAGWVAMLLPLVVSYLIGRWMSLSAAAGGGWRDRVLLWASPQAGKLALAAGTSLTLGLALLLSLSRSGIVAGVAAVALLTSQLISSRSMRGAMLFIVLVAASIAAFGWANPDLLIERFAIADWLGLGGRVGIWQDAMAAGRMFWLTGTGVNTFGDLMFVYQRHDLVWHYGEAHNDYLQVIVEGGLLVAVPAIVLLGALIREMVARLRAGTDDVMTRWIRFGAVAGLVAIGIQEIVDFTLQIPGAAVLFVVLCAIATHRVPPRHDPRLLRRH